MLTNNQIGWGSIMGRCTMIISLIILQLPLFLAEFHGSDIEHNVPPRVYVLVPTGMKIVEDIIEGEVGTPILIPLALYTILPDDDTETLVPFTTCRNLHYKVHIEDPNFVYDSKTFYQPVDPACVYLPVIGKQQGATLVTISYATGDRVFTDSVTVSTFRPLKIVEPFTSATVLAVGSSRQLVFQGGPRPLLDRVAEFTRKMVVTNSTVARVIEVQQSHMKDDLHIFEVVCQEVGQTSVSLEIGNSRLETNHHIPVRRTQDVQVICGDPAKIFISIEKVIKPDDTSISKCPHDISTTQVLRIPVPNYEDILVSVILKDRRGNRLENITSLNIQWKASLNIVTFHHAKFIPTEIIHVNDYNIPGKSYQTIMPMGKSGNIEITAEVVGYRLNVLAFYNLRQSMRLSKIDRSEEHLFQRSLSLDFQLVSDISLEPSSNRLFNHPSSKTSVKVNEGSGYFDVSTFPTSIVETTYFDNNKTIQIKPIKEGDVRIIVKDICLSGRPTAETTIKVNGVASIFLDVTDKIQVSNSVILNVLLFDKNGNELTPKDLSLIKLKPISLTTDLIDIQSIDSPIKIQYKLTGKNVGEATIGFVADGPSRSFRSDIKRIFVFQPLTVFPKQLTLLVGSVYQVLAQGGPQPDSLIEFSSEVKLKVAVTPIGIIQGRSLGISKVNAKAVDQTSNVIYSEDSLEVNVVSLHGLRIHTALNKIQVNQTMPVWAVGLSSNGVELDPTALFGGKNSLMTFEWSLGNTENAEMEFPFQQYGLVSMNDQPYFRFRAKRPGHVSIRLSGNMTGKVYTADVVVEILDELRILNAPISYTPILMSPNSEISLKTNKESSGSVTYMLQSLRSFEEQSWGGDTSIVSIDSTGTLRSLEKIGDAVIRVTFVDNNTGITESIGFVILVRLVAYHMLTPSLSIRFTSKRHNLDSIPRGISFPMTVSYHDALGRRFHVTSVSPKIRPNRFDVINLSRASENDTFYADAISEGRVGVLAYNLANPMSKDFLFVSIAEAIEPRLPMDVLDVGDVVCFSCGVKSMGNAKGQWSVSPTDVMQLDTESGNAWALSSGVAKVQYSIPGVGLITSVELNVRNVNRIAFYGPASTGNFMITNGDKESHFDIPIKLGDNIQSMKGNCDSKAFPINSFSVPFNCHLSFGKPDEVMEIGDLFTVSGVFLFGRGHYACRIKPVYNPKTLFYASTIRTNFILTATLNTYDKGRIDGRDSLGELSSIRTQTLTLGFQPALFLHVTHLEISSKEPEAIIYLTGDTNVMNQLKFIPSDSAFLEIEKHGSTKTDPFVNGFLPVLDQMMLLNKFPDGIETRGYRVHILSPYWLTGDFAKNLSVSLISQSSKQFIDISVKIKIVTPFMSGSELEGSGYVLGLLGWFIAFGYLWILVPITTILTLLGVHMVWKFLDPAAKEPNSDFVFISRPSPRSSTPRSSINSETTSQSSGKRLYSTDSNVFPLFRYSRSSSSSPASPMS